MNVKDLYVKLSKFYWSPEHPGSYTIKLAGQIAGIGLIAHQDYAAFNYAWAVHYKDLHSEAGHRAAIADWLAMRKFTDSKVLDSDLSWQLTRQNQESFKQWYAINWKALPQQTVPMFRKLYSNDNLQTLL